MNIPPHRHGFTLVELSVVLVIIGLIVGGVFSAQALIRTSEVRSILVDMQRYETAVIAFRGKYNAIPGDMIDATALWGSVTTSGGTCPGSIGVGTETCNGDGDGMIGTIFNSWDEQLRAWQHMANAGLIPGPFTGVPNATNPRTTFGVNVPGSKLANAGYSLVSQCPGNYGNGAPGTGTGQCWGPQSLARVAIMFGSSSDSTRGATILTPEEAYSLDAKSDDGLPDFGRIQSGTSSSCYSPNTSPSAYVLTQKKKVCNLTKIVLTYQE